MDLAAADESPFFLARISRLTKREGAGPGPDVIWRMEAMPGNLSTAGSTREEAEANFHAMLAALGKRLDAEGINRDEWWRDQVNFMSDAEKATWRLQTFMPIPKLRQAGGFPYFTFKVVKNMRMASRAA